LKTRTRRFIFDEPLIKNLYSNGAIDEQMACAVDSAHPTDSEWLLNPIFIVESLSDQRIWSIGGFAGGRVCRQRGLIDRTKLDVRRVVSSACWTKKHQ
jgi:hypothetical protein